MRIVITGGAGFLGVRLARTLLACEQVVVGGTTGKLEELILVDLTSAPADVAADPRVTVRTDGLSPKRDDPALHGVDAVVHLAAVVSSAAEADPELGLRINVDMTRALLGLLHRGGSNPVFVLASSLAVFGADAGSPLPSVITDDTQPRPESSYGTQKLISEHLVSDATRRGSVRGRIVRLMTVAVRPGLPNAAASSFVSGILREPIAGERAICPIDADALLAISSPHTTVAGLVRALGADEAAWPYRTAVTMPALTVTPRAMAAALDRVVPGEPSHLIDWIPDPTISAIVGSWPAQFESARANALGLFSDPDIDSIVRAYLDDDAPNIQESAP